MKTVISATTLARQLGDVLGRIRYRQDSFIVERNGVPVATIEPAGPGLGTTGIKAALAAWRNAAEPDTGFADTLERIGAADAVPGDPWAS